MSCVAPVSGEVEVRLPAGAAEWVRQFAGHESATVSADQGQLAPAGVDGCSQGGSVQLVVAQVATTALVPTTVRVRSSSCPPAYGRPDRADLVRSEAWLRRRLSVVFCGWRRVAQRGIRPTGLGGRHEVRFENLWWQESAEELRDVFAAYGPVCSVERWRDGWGDFTGAGSCTFARETSALQAVEALNGRVHGGVSVFVYLHRYGQLPR